MTDDLERRFLLVKRGLYYAPDNHGYTGIKERAGRYLESDAGPDSDVTAIHEDEAPDYSPACFHDIAREHLQGKVGLLRAENDAAKRVIKGWADWYRFATNDDECEYLNGKGWDDAEALADNAATWLLAAIRTGERG